MITRWATKYNCDRCRKDSPDFPDSAAAEAAGWLRFSPPITRPDGFVYNDLGPECLALPLAEVMRSPDDPAAVSE